MGTTLLSCANCGAPLTKQTDGVWPCIHCGAISRTKDDGNVEVESKVPDEVLASLRQLVLSGKRSEAERLAAQHGLPADTVDGLFKSIATRTLFSQGLNAFGWLMMFSFFGLVVWGIWLVAMGYKVALLIVAFGLLNLLVFRRSMAVSLEMIGKPTATATIRRITKLGVNGTIDFNALEIDVEPDDKSMGFRASIVAASFTSRADRVVVGRKLSVRYAPDRSWVRLRRRIDRD